MKTIQPFFFFALFLLSSSAVFGKSLPIASGNEPTLDNKQIKITLCVGGRNWKACLTIETSVRVSNTSFTANGTINDATKTLTITDLPKELQGQALKVLEDVSFVRTSTVNGKAVEEKLILKRGLFNVSKSGSLAMPVNRVLASNK